LKLVILIKGKKLDIENFTGCGKVSISGYIDKIIFINQNLERRVRHVENKCIIELIGKDLEIITKAKDMRIITGDVSKLLTYDTHGRLGTVQDLTSLEFV